MKFAIQEGLYPYNYTDKLYLQLKDWGFDAVEVMGQGLVGRLKEVKAASATAGLPVCAICPGLNGIRGSLLSQDAQVRDMARADIVSLLRCGAELGGAGLNIVPEFGAQKFMRLFPDLNDFEARKQQFVNELGPLAAEAQRLGVPILLEPLNRYEAYFLMTADQGADLCRMSGSPAVKILADLFHMAIEETDTLSALERNIAYIGHVHLADSNRKLPGQGQTRFDAVIQTLMRAGYSGACSMECAVTGDPAVDVWAALSFLKGIAGH